MLTSHPQSAEDPGVIIASSNPALRRRILEDMPPEWRPAEEALGGAEALGKLETTECRMLLLDRHLPDLDVEELTSLVRLRYPGVDVRTVDPELKNLTSSWKICPDWQASNARPGLTPECGPVEGMVGRSSAMLSVYRAIRKVAPRDTSVLITGETGTGKELVAQALHRLSPRAGKPLVVINCAAIPESLLESELFGYVRGAFTGAAQSRLGRIQAASGGSLFLDEIGEMPVALQAKLLRFLESGELQRLGSAETWKADVRVVAATNRNLRHAVLQQTFREDLYYRLNVFPIVLPSLRERREDIPELAEHFLRSFSPDLRFRDAAMARLATYGWPGNVRELRHVVERATIVVNGAVIEADDLMFDE